MASLKQYVTFMYDRQKIIARKLGCDIRLADKTTRVANLAVLGLIAVVIKTLTDRGVITDGDLLAQLDVLRDADYDDEPVDVDLDPTEI